MRLECIKKKNKMRAYAEKYTHTFTAVRNILKKEVKQLDYTRRNIRDVVK